MPVPAADLVDRAWARGWEPDPELDIPEWADDNRILTSKSAHVIGPWDTSLFPFSREWMMNMSPSSPVEETVVMSGRQMAKTDGLLLNTLGYWMACRSGPIQFVQPTVETGKLWRKQRLTPMIEACPALRSRIGKARSRDASDTLLFLEYPGGTLRIGGSNSSASLRIAGARLVLCDELEEYSEDADGHGDPLAIVRQGASNFPDRKLGFTGNPGIRGESRTEREFRRGDQRRYFIPCPHCAAEGHQAASMDILTWDGQDRFGTDKGNHHKIDWEKPVPVGVEPVAYMTCSRCSRRVDEHYKTWMLANGEWRPTAPGNGVTRSYQISGLYSPLGFRTWARCGLQFLEAKDRPSELKSFVQDVLGETFEERANKVEVEVLLEKGRREDYGAEVPHGVGVLVSSTDTQDDRLIHSVWGFGAGLECWLIDVVEHLGDPRREKGQPREKESDVWLMHDLSLERRFRHRSGQVMKIRRAVVDSGGHATDEVYGYCARRRSRGVFAVHGDKSQQKPLLGIPSRRNAYKAFVFPLCVDSGRADVLSALRIREPGAGYIHLPAELEEEWIKQLASTRSIWRRTGRSGDLVREWTRAFHPRDHLFDLAVYARAAVLMLGPAFVQRLGALAAKLSEPVEGEPEPIEEPEEVGEPEAEPDLPAAVTPLPARGSSWVQKGLPPGHRWRR
ncbi:MAG TPA: terminase gpA endonuclease subunit [Candidatus Eisenbacteria bacterium]|nr:terminase gpA endonuclease subunit [Candidatus Eisenbacteria bacterium]